MFFNDFGLLGPFWKRLEGLLGRLGGYLGYLGGILGAIVGHLRPYWRPYGNMMRHLGRFGPSWKPSWRYLGPKNRWETHQVGPGLDLLWDPGRGRRPPGTLFERNRIDLGSGTSDHPGLKPQGAADFGNFGLWMAPAAPGGVPEDAPRRAVNFGIKITQIGSLWPEFRPKPEIRS